MGIKLLGMSVVLLGGLILGISLNKRAEAELREAEGWTEFFRYVTEKVSVFGMPINEIISECDVELLKRCGFIENVGSTVSFKEMVMTCALHDRECENIARAFAESFGKADRLEQIKHCEYHTRLMETRKNVLAEKLTGQKKINMTLSVSVALAIIIILL